MVLFGRLFLFTLLLTSCLPQQQVRPLSNSLDENSSDTDTSDVIDSDTTLTWYYLNSSTNTLTFNQTNLDSVYLRGSQIQNYLIGQNDSSSNYCVEFSFSSSLPGPYRYRVRASSYNVNDLITGQQTKYLRVDFNNSSAASSVCNKDTLEFVNDTQTATVSYASISANVTFDIAEICPQCVSTLTVSSIKLYQLNTLVSPQRLDQISPTQVNMNLVSFRYNPTVTTSNPPSNSCSNSDCRSRGFDCCSAGQCVNDAAIKSGVNQSEAQFVQSQQEMQSNPLAYLNYPQYYHICSSAPPSDPDNGGDNPEDPNGDAQARLEALRNDYYCIEHLKENSESDPFHLAPYNSSATYDQNLCNTTDSNQTMYYENVLLRLYENCECEDETTLSGMLQNCPKYHYVVTQTTNNVPTGFECGILPDGDDGLPFQDLEVSVSSRSAPHRFFNEDGVEFNFDEAYPSGASQVQEGDVFEYLDTSKTQPVAESFGANSIIGPISTSLDKAMPAKIIDVELDQTYLISTESGFYTPCLSCAKDSWLENFTATPTSSQGTGLQSIGYTTRRDAFLTNTTLGNYEDTLFGRACWVPPTMIPFSHDTQTNVQTQRLNRLKTQAAFYVNGYQRDWFGFNKGAMIGSFDGVSWFAIGKGRIVTSTTTKLYLAINAPFADLAEDSTHVVSVREYDGRSTGATVDYNPDLSQFHPEQNEAATCQRHHYCETDTDCITQLGWEYSCANVSQLKTKWPLFQATTASEASGSATLSFANILAQGSINGDSPNRCVYRGAGALCRTDSQSLLASQSNKAKLLTCAPNFYCADLDFNNVFSQRVSRYAADLEDLPVANNHFYGQDANQLGRPLDYLYGNDSGSIPTQVKTIIEANLATIDSTGTNRAGICKPGKVLPDSSNVATLWNPFEQHRTNDAFARTDYISQIGSCYSNYFSDNKVVSCPVIGSDGNYYQFSSDTGADPFTQADYTARAVAQNSCGFETLLDTADLSQNASTISNSSPFQDIEAESLLNVSTLIQPTLVRDACLRKPGAVCHTDLDCSPNRLHADQVELFDTDYFGSEANKTYYEEYLVCGQTAPQPFPSQENFDTYDMTLNRCCREVGKDLTTYTEDTPVTILTDDSSTNFSSTLSSNEFPNDPSRYQRMSVVENLGSSDYPLLSAYDDRDPDILVDDIDTNFPINQNVMTENQWKTLDEVNSKTCCGGGWIRKFADGTTDWTNTSRFSFDVKNFSCLNYRTPLIGTLDLDYSLYGMQQSDLSLDRQYYCTDSSGQNGNCAQFGINTSSDTTCSTIQSCPASDPYCPTGALITGTGVNRLSTLDDDNDFGNNPFVFFAPFSADDDTSTMIDWTLNPPDARYNVTIRVPSYLGEFRPAYDDGGGKDGAAVENGCAYPTSNLVYPVATVDLPAGCNQLALGDDTNVANLDTANLPYFPADPNTYVKMVRELSDGSKDERYCVYDGDIASSITDSDSDSDQNSCPRGPASTGDPDDGHNCCFHYEPSTRILKVVLEAASASSGWRSALPANGEKYGVVLEFNPPGTGDYFIQSGNTTTVSKPSCSDAHYLSILGLLELKGIPQITYPKMVCNNDFGRLVPGIYDIADGTGNVLNFDTENFSFTTASGLDEDRRTNMKGVVTEDIFSSHEFKCCTPLGQATTDTNTCCSGYGVSNNGSSNFTCTLPSGTDLHVYFNRYVSNEGIGDDLPGGGLSLDDFDPLTGEPLLTTPILQKISALGTSYCEEGNVRRGGAFGEFNSEPYNSTNSQTVYGIVDSSTDSGTSSVGGQTVNVGFQAFIDGFRWNHHLYCD